MKSRFFALALAALVVVACNGNKPAAKKMTVGNDSKDDQKFAYMLGAQFGAQFAAIGSQFGAPMDPSVFIQGMRDSWKMTSDTSFRLQLRDDTLNAVGSRFQQKAAAAHAQGVTPPAPVKPVVPEEWSDAPVSVTAKSTDDQKFAYLLGIQFGSQLPAIGNQFNTKLDNDVFLQGVRDAQSHVADTAFKMQLPDDSLRAVGMRYQQKAMALRAEEQKKFDEEQKKLKEEVAPLRGDTLPDGTPRKMNFRVKVTGISLEATDLEAYSGKPLLVFYFSSTCGHCRHATPEVLKIVNDYKDQGLTSIAIAAGSNNKRGIRGFMDDMKVENMAVLFDEAHEFGTLYSDGYVPKIYVVHPDGSFTEYKDFMKEIDKVRAEIAKLLKK